MLYNKRDIKEEYKNLFLEVLKNINEYFELDIESIKKTLNEQKFPKNDQSIMFLAVSGEKSNSYLPFQPVISITGAPNHVSQKTSILEFKIYDTRNYSGNIVMRVSLSIFPQGRQILKAYGLQLDTHGKNKYQPFTMVTDKIEFSRINGLLELMRSLIEKFPITNEESMKYRRDCLTDLDKSVQTGVG